MQNVVIYTTIIAVDNPRLELLPGMTANLRVETDRRENVVRVPNAALRWRPARDAVPAPAETGAPARAPSGGGPRGNRALADLREALKSEIEPSANQAKEIEAAFADARKAFAALAGEDQNTRREQARGIRKELETRIAAALDAGQRPKFADLIARLGNDRATQAGRLFVVGRDGKPQALAVRLGASDGGLTEVVSGLEAGQDVITGGTGRLGDGGTQRAPRRFGF